MELANYEQLRNICILYCIIVPRQSIIPTDLSSSPNIPTVEDQWGWIPLIVATFNSPAPLFLIHSNTNNNTNINFCYSPAKFLHIYVIYTRTLTLIFLINISLFTYPTIFIGPESDHWLCLSLTDSVTFSRLDGCEKVALHLYSW